MINRLHGAYSALKKTLNIWLTPKHLRLLFLSVLLLLGYQNCGSGGGFQTLTDSDSASGFNNAASVETSSTNCMFNSQVIADGESVQAFKNGVENSGSMCVSESRLCSAGVLQGSYTFSSCGADQSSCQFNGQVLLNGASVTGFSLAILPYGGNCDSVTTMVKCSNGRVLPTTASGTCSVASPSPCSFNSVSTPSGGVSVGYTSNVVPYGTLCSSVAQSLTCTNGSWSQATQSLFGSCSVSAPLSCGFNGNNILHGQSVTAYLTDTVAAGQTCAGQTRICTNGILSGSNSYIFGICTPATAAPATCPFGTQTLASGATAIGYSTASVPFGAACSSAAISVSCNNGSILPTNASPTCSVNPASSCSFNGVSYASNSSVIAFTSPTVPNNVQCSSVSQNLTCTNGSWNPSSAGLYSSCSQLPAADCIFGGSTINNNNSVLAYSAASVSSPQTCASISESRSCRDGVLSGSFSFPTCTSSGSSKAIQIASITYGGGGAVATGSAFHLWGGCTYKVDSTFAIYKHNVTNQGLINNVSDVIEAVGYSSTAGAYLSVYGCQIEATTSYRSILDIQIKVPTGASFNPSHIKYKLTPTTKPTTIGNKLTTFKVLSKAPVLTSPEIYTLNFGLALAPVELTILNSAVDEGYFLQIYNDQTLLGTTSFNVKVNQ